MVEFTAFVEDRDAPSLDVDHEYAGIELVPRLRACSNYHAPAKRDFA